VVIIVLRKVVLFTYREYHAGVLAGWELYEVYHLSEEEGRELEEIAGQELGGKETYMQLCFLPEITRETVLEQLKYDLSHKLFSIHEVDEEKRRLFEKVGLDPEYCLFVYEIDT